MELEDEEVEGDDDDKGFLNTNELQLEADFIDENLELTKIAEKVMRQSVEFITLFHFCQ